jgi:hypothetical protein
MDTILIPLWILRERIAKYVPCICTPDYTERDLIAPDCRHHDAMDALDELEEEYPF